MGNALEVALGNPSIAENRLDEALENSSATENRFGMALGNSSVGKNRFGGPVGNRSAAGKGSDAAWQRVSLAGKGWVGVPASASHRRDTIPDRLKAELQRGCPFGGRSRKGILVWPRLGAA